MTENIKILCIDDEAEIRFALSAVIESQGWQAITSDNVEQSLILFEKFPPNIILIDYHMPKINGLDGVRMLRKKSLDVPIIVFTADDRQSLADEFLDAGASDFATKPIKAPDIISRIKLHIRLLGTQAPTALKLPDIKACKGIGVQTLTIIIEALSTINDFTTVDELVKTTHLAPQTTYRYLQHLSNENVVEVKVTYGKIGRPKQFYKLK